MQTERIRINATDFYNLPEYEQHTLIQLIDGEVVIGMAPVPKHQFILSEIVYLFMNVGRKKGGRVASSTIEVYLDEHDIYRPDALYLKPDSQCTVGDKNLIGAPDLIVEILSPSTARYDRQQKYQAYERHGVDEYWIVDPTHEIIEVFQQADGKFDRLGAFGVEDIFTSRPLDETVIVKDIFDV